MARVKISEYRAKRIILGDTYAGIQIRSGDSVPSGSWVAKVDQGVKKRFKQGLLVIDKPKVAIEAAIREWEKKGFSQFLLEPLFPHDASEEQYFSLERVRDGIRILHARDGGVDIEAHPEQVYTGTYATDADIAHIAKDTALPEEFLRQMVATFEKQFFAFVEINPLVVKDDAAHLLDAAVLVDSAGAFFVRNGWTDDDIIKAPSKHAAEAAVESLSQTTAASLKLSVIDPNGSLFFLLSGGGGSIVIADEAQLEGAGDLIANYGEYSGGPTTEETYLYAKEIVQLMLASKAQRKALVIAGGVANFTDVKITFRGIIDALKVASPAMREQGVKVFVRRGGPNEEAGLDLMREFLGAEGLLGSVHGSDTVITKAVEDAIAFIRS